MLRGGTPDPAVFKAAAEGLRSQAGGSEIDTVVLACTHFPLLEPQLAEALGGGVRFIHGAEGIARRIAFLTQGQEFAREKPDLALFTADPDQIAYLAPALRQHGLDRLEPF